MLLSILSIKRKWFSLKLQHLQSEATLHSLRTMNWIVSTDCFSFREVHVSFWWMLLRSLMHFQKKMIFSESTAFSKEVNLHSLHTVNWRVWTDCFSFRYWHVSFSRMLRSSLMPFQKKVFLSEITALQSEVALRSLLTVNWSVWKDWFSFRETHVSFPECF